MQIYSAPLQGFTEAPWRHFHSMIYGGIDSYITPFIRFEKGEVRARDIRDITSPLNTTQPTIPQIIFNNQEEFCLLTEKIIDCGYTSINLNMGCPFPLQVHKGRGAALISNVQLIRQLATLVSKYDNIQFSVKMRLGLRQPTEWRDIISMLNDTPLTEITLHPRTASQQYSGEINMDEFIDLTNISTHPVIYNGDITTATQIQSIKNITNVAGVMIGRGLLSRPSLATETISGTEWTREQRIKKLSEFHDALLQYYSAVLSGTTQIISKLKPFWEYLEPEIGHKAAKAIHKSNTMEKYLAATASALMQ